MSEESEEVLVDEISDVKEEIADPDTSADERAELRARLDRLETKLAGMSTVLDKMAATPIAPAPTPKPKPTEPEKPAAPAPTAKKHSGASRSWFGSRAEE